MSRDGNQDKGVASQEDGVGISVGNNARQVAVNVRDRRERGIKLKGNQGIAKCMQTMETRAGEKKGG